MKKIIIMVKPKECPHQCDGYCSNKDSKENLGHCDDHFEEFPAFCPLLDFSDTYEN